MNSVIVSAVSTARAAPSTGHAGGVSADASTGGGSFGTTLAGTIGAVAAARKPAGPATPATTGGALQAKIAKLLKAGRSESEIISTLAADLADSVAQALGTPGADARNRLKTLFAGALAPPGNAAAGSLADRMRSLAQRFAKLKDTAVALIEAQMPGQQNRIAGNFLDAKPAKEHPAPASTLPVNATPIDRERDGQIAGPVPATDPATASPPPTGSPAAAFPAAFGSGKIELPGDGRSVKLGATPAIASGGDTLLGRVLTRAVLAADARTPVAPATPATAAGATVVTPAAGPPSAAATEKTLVGFMKAFEATLGTAERERVATGDGPAPLPAVATHAATGAAPAVIAATVPLRIEAVSASAASAPAAAAPPVDQSAIVDQVLRGAFLRNTGASSEMRLSLVPQTLGDVNIKLIVTAGNVTAHVVAQTPEVRDALVAAQPQLSKSLADAGLKLQSFTVDLSGNGFTGFSQQQRNAPNPDGYRAVGATAIDDANEESGLDAVPTFGPPDTSRFATGYNYLA